MPDISFTAAERTHMAEVLRRLDPAGHDLTREFRTILSKEEWDFVVEYVRAKMRVVLEAGLLMRSVGDAAKASQLVDEGAIRKNFLHSLWTYDFAFRPPIENTFVQIAGGSPDARLCLAVEALVELAEDAMFATFDEACDLLLE